MSTVKLKNPLGHVIQEITVMRNRHDRARKSFKKRSNQDTDSASKWFVGSSRSNMSGLDSNKRQMQHDGAHHLKASTSASQAGRFNASAAISSWLFRLCASQAWMIASSFLALLPMHQSLHLVLHIQQKLRQDVKHQCFTYAIFNVSTYIFIWVKWRFLF
jgi:hypothetical protein